MKRFQSVSDPALVVTGEELRNLKCTCGAGMTLLRHEEQYLPDRGNRTALVLRYTDCCQRWRFVEVLKFDYCKVPISIAISALLRDFKSWCSKYRLTTSDVVIIIGALVWIVLTLYVTTL